MTLNLRTALEVVRLYSPMWQLLALSALASASHALATLLSPEAHGEIT